MTRGIASRSLCSAVRYLGTFLLVTAFGCGLEIAPSSRTLPGVDDPDNPARADAITINRIQPAASPVTGNIQVEIVGTSFPQNLAITFNDTLAEGVQVVSANAIRCLVPPQPMGASTVTIQDLDDQENIAVLPGGFVYFAPLTIDSVSPTRLTIGDRSIVTLEGENITSDVLIRLGQSLRIEPIARTPTSASFRMPLIASGMYQIGIENRYSSANLPNPFQVVAPLQVQQASPFALPLAPNQDVVLVGDGLIEDTTVTIEDQLVPFFPLDGAHQALVTPPTIASESLRDLIVDNGFTERQFDGALAYVDTNNPLPRLVGVFPSSGTLAGGNEVSIAGQGLDALGLLIFFGSEEANCQSVSPIETRCTVPSYATAGLVTLRATSTSFDVTLVDAFQYVDLALNGVSRNRVSIAGGARVGLQGNGFTSNTEVFLDGIPTATDFVDTQNLIITIPGLPSALPNLTLRVVEGFAEVVRDDLLEAWDPTDLVFWTRGAARTDTLDVSVVDTLGQRIHGAFITISDPTQQLIQGHTDDRGLFTWSSPALAGEITVTAAATERGAFTWVDSDREALTLRLGTVSQTSANTAPDPPEPEPQPDPGEPPEPEPTGTPIIEGEILRVKDAFNTGSDVVVVTTTQAFLGAGLPNPGAQAQVLNQGPYRLQARTGEMVVVAQAGQIDAQGTFVPRALGFSAPIRLSPGEVMTDLNLVIDTPLNQNLAVRFVDPPTSPEPTPFVPNGAYGFVWYDFGASGLYPMGEVTEPNQTELTFAMPTALPSRVGQATYSFEGGLYVISGQNRATPATLVRREGLQDTTTPLDLAPVLSTFGPIEPASNAITTSLSTFVYAGFTPATSEAPSAIMHVLNAPGSSLRWTIMTPGGTESFVLPTNVAPGEPFFEPGFYSWQLTALYRPGSDYTQLNVPALTGAWTSRSFTISVFELAP